MRLASLALDERNGGRCKQALVQNSCGVGAAAIGMIRGTTASSDFWQRQQHQRAGQIEDRVNECDMERIDSGRDERKAENRVCSLKQRQPDDCADDIEAQMHDGCAPRVLVRADGGQHGRHARADVLSHDNGDRCAVATAPVEDSACRIPTDADEDCTMPVRIAPARTPRMGFENNRKNFVKFGSSRSPETELDSDSMPNISVAKPRSDQARVLFLCPLRSDTE